jgi:hypothetical protein
MLLQRRNQLDIGVIVIGSSTLGDFEPLILNNKEMNWDE